MLPDQIVADNPPEGAVQLDRCGDDVLRYMLGVPEAGIGRICGDLASSQAIAIWRGLTPRGSRPREPPTSGQRPGPGPRAGRQHFLVAYVNDRLRRPVGQVVAILYRHHGRKLQCLPRPGFRHDRHGDEADLALVLELGQGANGLGEGHPRVRAVAHRPRQSPGLANKLLAGLARHDRLDVVVLGLRRAAYSAPASAPISSVWPPTRSSIPTASQTTPTSSWS
jgi:hypothetical protein